MSSCRLAVLAAAAVGIVLPRAARADVVDYIGKTVQAVAVEIDRRPVNDARLLSLIETHTGDPLRIVEVRESITHLFSLGRFEGIEVRAEPVGTAIKLAYELVSRRPISDIEFAGAEIPGVDRGHLRNAIAERFGASPRESRADDMARLVEDELHAEGYLRAAATAQVERRSGQTPALLFHIDAGPRTRIEAIDVKGDPGMSVSALLNRLQLSVGSPLRHEALNARIDRYLADRRSHGFYTARLAVAPAFADEDHLVRLTLTATLGPRTRVVFKGDPLPSDRRDELVPVAREGSTDEDLLEDSTNRIEDFFRAQGYRDASAPHVREETDGELLLTFTVRKGPQYRVAQIEVAGNTFIPLGTLQARLRVKAGQPFSAAALQGDVATLEDIYRRQGFAAVQVNAATNIEAASGTAAEVPVAIRITIDERVRTLVTSVRFQGVSAFTDAELREDLGLQPGSPYFLTQLAIDRDAIELQYANQGYQSATVTSNPGLSADGARADVVFGVREGPQVFVDHILIVGNERTKAEVIQRELQFKPSDPLGLQALSDSQRRLAALGLFRRARISELRHGADTRRDVLITVEEAPLTTVGWGGGLEVRSVVAPTGSSQVAAQELLFAPRGTFEIGRRNLFGRNRSVNLFTSASLFQDKNQTSSPNGERFPEYRILGQYREPNLRDSGADFRVTGTLEQQIRSGFDFARRSASAELAGRPVKNLSVSAGYQIQNSRVFNQVIEPSEQRAIDRILPKVRLSLFAASAIRDTRDDPVDPHAGGYLSVNGEVAGKRIGSEVGFAKSFFTAQTFSVVSPRRRVVFALSGRLGLATAFPGALGDDSRDLPASERFFAGGDTTVRGFALDQLGVRHNPPQPSDTLDSSSFPLGGNASVILNAELRAPVRGGVGVVGFFDAGNVFKTVRDIDLPEIRGSVGFGLRYRSPIGPIRVDLGFKVHRNSLPDGSLEARSALHISLGQAF